MSDFSDATLSLTCPACQHAWEIEIPAIPWRALPAYLMDDCPFCHARLRVCLQERERQLQVSIKEVKEGLSRLADAINALREQSDDMPERSES